MPTGHKVHDAADKCKDGSPLRSTRFVPAGHGRQDTEAGTLAKVPIGQPTHCAAPGSVANVPFGQTPHKLARADAL